ncbi:hypothetical protein [Nostoc sp.]|uniref:hypothetical protein n=1 Tax=Nostoc sp. TaxID=1180 RepID=UPI002FF97FFB
MSYPYGEASYAQRLVEKCWLRLRYDIAKLTKEIKIKASLLQSTVVSIATYSSDIQNHWARLLLAPGNLNFPEKY